LPSLRLNDVLPVREDASVEVPLSSVDRSEIVAEILSSGRQLVIAVTGGGSGAISALVQTPGASRAMLEAVVPYSLAALESWLGGKPDQACSEATARAMAMAAFMRARRLAPDADALMLVGVGCTASLASDRPKRGDHRVHVAVQTARRTNSDTLPLDKKNAKRADEEQAAANLVLAAAAEACGIDAAPLWDALPGGRDRVVTDSIEATDGATDLLLGAHPLMVIGNAADSTAVFPGAFNPPHAGHLRMAEVAERRLGTTVTWELSIANVDKPPLDFITIRDRLSALTTREFKRNTVLTRAPTFREKAALFPGATFAVGADTLERIAEPRYYGGDVAKRDAAVGDIAARGCRFLAFGRIVNGRFQTLADMDLPPALRALCDEVPESEFREDVSSTELRRRESPPPT
jgi:nicotinamide mononucleotide (NMN) deamidase PncC